MPKLGFQVLIFAALAYATGAAPAHAYLDPGTGSMILQVLIGGIAGLALAGRFYWNRLMVLIGVRSEPPAQTGADEVSGRSDR
ncbi:MAG TPA: hypothetical protein VK022_02720 [Paracoccaceae bacterium]|nr:hypothetical protein [Paracoccaceae bacterium]